VRSQLRKNLVGSKFEALPGPSPNALRVILNMELMSARGFNYDNLYIEYLVKPGPGWWTSNKKALRGVTQISKTTTYPVDPLSKEDPMGAFTKVCLNSPTNPYI
jgi:Meckel syndrome type 1 protein